MMALKISLVTFPVDFGNVTLQNNFLAMLKDRADVRHYTFSPTEAPDNGERFTPLSRLLARFRETGKLRRICSEARREGRVVMFQQISPALFSLPFLLGVRSYILSDWTRKLYEPILDQKITNAPITWTHSLALKAVTGVITFTDAAAESLVEGYGLPRERLHKIPMPFDVFGTDIAACRTAGPVRILFVGGDFYRKGGDVLLRWFQSHRGAPVELTFMTQTELDLPPNVSVIRNNPKDSAKKYFRDYDLFVLPTRCDAYPQAIGEAASAGLALVTTDKALGAPEVIDEGMNGHVASTEEQLFRCLSALVADRERLERFKAHSREKLIAGFSYAQVFARLASIIDADPDSQPRLEPGAKPSL
jgi:glycosyltransferase involved in cell wall biosynthesis